MESETMNEPTPSAEQEIVPTADLDDAAEPPAPVEATTESTEADNADAAKTTESTEADNADAAATSESTEATSESTEKPPELFEELSPDGSAEDATTAEPPDGSAEDATNAETDVQADADLDRAAEPVPSGPRTVGRFVADGLRTAGVRYAFTVPGESFLGLLDGLNEAGIRIVTTRHEGAAAFMADAYGQLTGRPGACIGTRAVGAANLAIGIHTARANSTPMFALVGQVTRADRGREAFQEIDQVETFGRLAKWAIEPASVAEIPEAVSRAIVEATTGRPGPVLISLAEDLLDEIVPEDAAPPARPPVPRAEIGEIRAVLQLLASARWPVILAGAGVLRARTSSDLTRLAELLHVPVISAWRRGDVVSNDHPLYLGMAGFGAPTSVRERLERADAMLVIGCRLNEITSYGFTIPGPDTLFAHVDLAPTDGSRGRAPDIVVRSDARSFLRGAVQRLRGAVLDAALVEARREANDADRKAWEEATVVDTAEWSGPGVHPGKIVSTLRRVLPDEAILTTDAGNFAGWAARGFRFRRPGTFLGPTSGAMGYGLPAAIAASLVHRDRPVVALVGDGGLAMTMAELETAVREGARPIVVCFDNERYGTIRMHQDRRPGSEPLGTDLGPVDFTAIARACGARGARVDSDDAFEPALRQALASDRPTVIQLTLDRRWLSVDQPPSD
jgi:acetolactate synthase-1/2/3 large subunit